MKKLVLFGIVFIMMISLVNGVLIYEKLTDTSESSYLTGTSKYRRQEIISNGTYTLDKIEIALGHGAKTTSPAITKSPIVKLCISNNTINSCVEQNCSGVLQWWDGSTVRYNEHNFTFTGVSLKANTVYNLTAYTRVAPGYNLYWAARTPENAPNMYNAYSANNFTSATLSNRTQHTRLWSAVSAPSDSCTYSGTGNWIITNNCNITTTVKIQTGYSMLIGTGKTVKFQTGGLLT